VKFVLLYLSVVSTLFVMLLTQRSYDPKTTDPLLSYTDIKKVLFYEERLDRVGYNSYDDLFLDFVYQKR